MNTSVRLEDLKRRKAINLIMENKVAWNKYSKKERKKLETLNRHYINFISNNKTERECTKAAVKMAKESGYKNLADVIESGKKLKVTDKIYATSDGKTIMLVHIGKKGMSEGFNILGAHIDSPRLDIKQNPLFEKGGLSLLDTHYYGGIKKYQWVTLPLALHGVVTLKSGKVININIGESKKDPVLCISDLLPHLAAEQMNKSAKDFIEGDALDVIVGNEPLRGEKKDAVKANTLRILKKKYGFKERDFLSAELEIVPAGRARELGLDKSMVIGYGQDDRVCAFTSLVAQLDLKWKKITPDKTAVTILVDKEEIGSVGATSMSGAFFENTLMEIARLLGDTNPLAVRRAFQKSKMLSSDVNAGVDPHYEQFFETKNASYCGKGLVFSKFTGSRGKSGSNDANAEYVAKLRDVMDKANVSYQFSELGRVDVGGGGTIAYIPANLGIQVIDSGVAVLSMHSPWEITSKCDVWEAYRGYIAFLENA